MANGLSTLTRLQTRNKDFTGSATAAPPHSLNRFAGGSRSKTTPFISGYWYVYLSLPSVVFSTGKAKSESWLHSSAEGFTPHGRNLTKVDTPGMGGMGASFISGQQINRQFSITFGDYQNLPIYNTIRQWTSIFDEHSGVSEIQLSGNRYKGKAHIFLGKPQITADCKLSIDDIEEYYGYDGVWPETSPIDALASDISTNDRATPTVQFNFDGNPLTRYDLTVTELDSVFENTISSKELETKKKIITAITTEGPTDK